MKRLVKIRHEFVDFIPKNKEDGVLYVSIPYATAVHNCFCGCGTKVVTPISPVGWNLTFDGETVSLSPSVGNWSFACRSHYVIRRDTVVWAGDMSEDKIARGRQDDKAARESFFVSQSVLASPIAASSKQEEKKGFWSWFVRRK